MRVRREHRNAAEGSGGERHELKSHAHNCTRPGEKQLSHLGPGTRCFKSSPSSEGEDARRAGGGQIYEVHSKNERALLTLASSWFPAALAACGQGPLLASPSRGTNPRITFPLRRVGEATRHRLAPPSSCSSGGRGLGEWRFSRRTRGWPQNLLTLTLSSSRTRKRGDQSTDRPFGPVFGTPLLLLSLARGGGCPKGRRGTDIRGALEE